MVVKREKGIFKWWKELIKYPKQFIISIILALISSVLIYFSRVYTGKTGLSKPNDLLLDHLPIIDLSIFYIIAVALVIIFFFLYPLITNPSRFSYVLAITSLYFAVHSLFIVMTHLAIPAEAINISGIVGDFISFSNAQFFSGFTGFAFLGYLINRNNKPMRRFMFLASIFIGITVLLMHRHYSIDVLSAYFITYGIFKLGDRIFV